MSDIQFKRSTYHLCFILKGQYLKKEKNLYTFKIFFLEIQNSEIWIIKTDCKKYILHKNLFLYPNLAWAII